MTKTKNTKAVTKVINTIAEWNQAMEEAKANGEPVEFDPQNVDTYILTVEVSEEKAKEIYAREWAKGTPQGDAPFVQPDDGKLKN